MSDENNSPIEIKADLTETINNAYNDTLSKPLQSASAIVTTTLDFIHNTICLPMQKYNLYAQDKINNFQKELETGASNIPPENLVAPRVNILGPSVEALKYNLDEEYLKNMFTNLLLADMDITQQPKVHPSYIRIINQLSDNDAKFLELLTKYNNGYAPSIELTLSNHQTASGVLKLDRYAMLNHISNNSIEKLNPLIIDNLIMHRLIEITYDEFYTYPNANLDYQTIFNSVKNNYTIKPDDKLSYVKGYVRLTDFGKNFVDVCIH